MSLLKVEKLKTNCILVRQDIKVDKWVCFFIYKKMLFEWNNISTILQIEIQQKDGFCPTPGAMAVQVVSYLEERGYLEDQ